MNAALAETPGMATHGSDGVALAMLSRQGGRDYNEDACGRWHSEQDLCCVLADGAGGHGGGEVAARSAVRHMVSQFAAAPLQRPQDLLELIKETNALVIAHRADAPTLGDMHSTVVGLFINLARRQALWGHVGDSRLYAFRHGRLVTRTVDHSLVQSLVDAGLLQAQDIASHPKRSELLSALGVPAADIQISVLSEPWGLEPGDAFLLCSDGLWEFVSDAQLCDSLAGASSPADWLALLEQQVLSQAAAAARPQHDNFSGIAVWIGQPALSQGEPHGHASL